MEEPKHIQNLNWLYKEYNERFIHFAKSYVFAQDVAEDIVIESFMSYWENHTKLTEASNVPAYILTIVKNKCLNHLQRLRVEEEAEKQLYKREAWELNMQIKTLQACDPTKLFNDEVVQIVKETLMQLPEQTREIFIRSRHKDQSHKEIAKQTGISTKSVEYHITKALAALRSALTDYILFATLMAIFLF